ncbi:MAG: hypothetical protein ACTSQI_01195 [Candidatus Helarchaeota archaeon]
MAVDLGTALSNMMQADPNITAVTVIDVNGIIVMQTENWDLSPDLPAILGLWQGGGGSLIVQGIKYVTLDVSPERLVGTNVQGQGSIVGMSVGSGKIIAYVAPSGEPRSALQTMIEATRGLRL